MARTAKAVEIQDKWRVCDQNGWIYRDIAGRAVDGEGYDTQEACQAKCDELNAPKEA